MNVALILYQRVTTPNVSQERVAQTELAHNSSTHVQKVKFEKISEVVVNQNDVQ